MTCGVCPSSDTLLTPLSTPNFFGGAGVAGARDPKLTKQENVMQTQMRTCLSLLLSLRPPANPQTEADDPADAPMSSVPLGMVQAWVWVGHKVTPLKKKYVQCV